MVFLPLGAGFGHTAFPWVRDVAELAMVAGVVDGLLDAGRQAVVHFGDERADATGVAGPLVTADGRQVRGGSAVDGFRVET